MTRDEAIAELLCMAEQLASYRKSMLTPQKIEWEAEDLAEIKAALAEPDAPRCEDCNAELVNHACPDEPDYCLVCDLGDALKAAQKANRCQHQAADATLDCTDPAVLCEVHGGHDACAVEIMRLQGDIAEHVNDYQIGAQDARDEIARALKEWGRYARKHLRPMDGADALDAAAEQIVSGSIREWLPKENG